jgi:hypothetical protein
MMLRHIGLMLMFIPVYLLAQTSEPSSLVALSIANAPKLDGLLEEDSWQAAHVITNFTQRELHENQPVTEQTRVAAVYTSSSLFFGVWCFDREPDKLVAKEMKRDFTHSSEDNFEIIIDTYHDKRNGYLFIINPNGARKDALVTDEGREVNVDWNGVWEVAARVTNEGWFAEIEIPFSTLKFGEGGSGWGINFERNIRRKKEQVLWQGWSRDYDLEQVSHAGALTGLRGMSSGHLLEIRPYATSGFEKSSGASADGVNKIGGDLNYLITSNLKLNVTAHTDFAQVESDRAQINLSRFSLFFPEKREFFLEGRDVFNFNLGPRVIPFYSRRIGIKDGNEIPIIGGGRLLGKAGSLTVGALSLQTAKEGNEPSTNYSVVRLKQEVLAQSNIGMLVTAKHGGGHASYVYGIDANWVTSKIFGDKNLAIGAAMARSHTDGNAVGNDLAYRAYLSFPNDHVEFDMAYDGVQRRFNPEIGFLRRERYKHFFAELQINLRPAFLPFIRKMEFKPLDVDYFWNDATNKLESIDAEWRPLGFATKSGEFMEYNIQRFFDAPVEDFEIGSAVIPAGRYWFTRHEIQANTFSGRKIYFEGEASTGDFYTGTRTLVEALVKLNVNKHLNFSADYAWNKLNLDGAQFTTQEVGGRVEYAFTTKLNATLLGQWNNEDDEILLNFRVHWIPIIGSDFYLAVNQFISTTDSDFKFEKTAVLSKLVWRFAY